jgi:hypothetical protein
MGGSLLEEGRSLTATVAEIAEKIPRRTTKPSGHTQLISMRKPTVSVVL